MSSLTEYTANCFILEGIDFYIHNKYVCVSLSPISSFENCVLLSGHFHCHSLHAVSQLGINMAIS